MHKLLPIKAALMSVPKTANMMIVPKLVKNARVGIKYPASKTIGGRRYKKNILLSRTYK
jgi:hypothetical protein